MKKFLLILPVLVLLAAGCEKGPIQRTGDTSMSTETKTEASAKPASKADAVVNDLLSDIDAEESASTQSDTTIVKSDVDVVIDNARGVPNAN